MCVEILFFSGHYTRKCRCAIMYRIYIVICLILTFVPFQQVFGDERLPEGINASLALKIGERLHLSQKQGCATCHKIDGTGGTKAGAANLRTPKNWKSTLIAKTVNGLGLKHESTRSISVGLILNGAEKWNSEFYDRPKYSEVKDKIFFDKRMIGVHSTALKSNRRMAKRLLKKNKKRVGGKKLLQLMAESVYIYMEKNLFDEEAEK